AALLGEYIVDLKKEFERRSNIVRIDISNLHTAPLSESSQDSNVPTKRKHNKRKTLEERREHYHNTLKRNANGGKVNKKASGRHKR
ncbi:hypothetical protein IJ596_06030, partial [bacterium]|nr:hypothetical protein [bacterium]